MTNQTKIYTVADLAEKIKSAKSVALIDYQGLTAMQVSDLRDKIREVGGVMEVTKNTFISRAFALAGVKLEENLTGPTALVFANESEITPLKAIAVFARTLEKPQFKLGTYLGKLLTVDDLKRFASLPGRETLYAQLVGGLANPLVRLVGALKYNQTKLVLTIKAISQKK